MLAEAGTKSTSADLEKSLAEEKAQVELLKRQLEKAKGKVLGFDQLFCYPCCELIVLNWQMRRRRSRT